MTQPQDQPPDPMINLDEAQGDTGDAALARSGGPSRPDELDAQFEQWRGYVRQRKTMQQSDVDELEDHLRGSVDQLMAAGLKPDEAFLVAVKRMGSLDELSREFAREHSDRLWKQLVLAGDAASPAAKRSRNDLVAMLICAVGAALSVKVPELFGVGGFISDDTPVFWVLNASLFTLPWLAAFLLWRRRAKLPVILAVAALFALGAVAANIYPFPAPDQDAANTLLLSALHLPLALWLVVGVAYVASDWRSSRRRMDFIRFTGEWFIYINLIGAGGGVLMAFLFGIFKAIDINPEEFVVGWVIPCGLMASVVVAGWLVEVKQGVVEAIAPVLTRLFTPLFTVLLLAFLVAFGWTTNGLHIERDALVLFDLMLVVVLGLLLYSISARDPLAPPGLFDKLQLGLVVSALLIDALVLAEISGRFTDEYGTTPNRLSALGENVILLVNLAVSAWLLLGFIRRRRPFSSLERWQTGYLPVYAIWFWIVVLAFPPIFDYV